MASRNTYTSEQRATAVASVLSGVSAETVAKQVGAPSGTVRAWVHDYAPSDVATLKRVESEDLIDRFYSEALTGFIATAQLLQDAKYTRKHTPSENAILFGVLADKWLYLLERGQRASAVG